MNGKENNIRILSIIAKELKDLRNQVVFVGGCATALLVTDPATPNIRHTLDVDFIVDVISFTEFNRFENQLRELGFRNSVSADAPICRWEKGGILIDVMPSDVKILGFTNKWYKATIENAEEIKLPQNISVKMASAAYFLATKLEAFKYRGANDFLASHDIEDIITIIDGRPELIEEIGQTKQDLRIYLSNEFGNLLENQYFMAALPGYLNYGVVSYDRSKIVCERIKKLVISPKLDT